MDQANHILRGDISVYKEYLTMIKKDIFPSNLITIRQLQRKMKQEGWGKWEEGKRNHVAINNRVELRLQGIAYRLSFFFLKWKVYKDCNS